MKSHLFSIAFKVSIVSYVAFLLMEYIRPGFVAYTFSPHLFLIAILITGIGHAATYKEQQTKSVIEKALSWAMPVVLGLCFAALVWREGSAFEDLRFLVAASAFALPVILRLAFQSKK